MKMKILIHMSLAIVLVISIAILSFMLPDDLHDLISGKVTAQAYISYTPPKNCTVDLYEGVNMVSFYCEALDTPVNESLVNFNETSLDYYAIFRYDSNTAFDHWSSYKPGLPSWAKQDLNTISRRNGYAIIMNSEGTYYREGYAYLSTQIPLYAGWNFIGYPFDENETINNVLAQINGKYTRVEAYRTIEGSGNWLLYLPGTGGTLTVMVPMEGYWILMNENATLVVP
jgi:hypothetical protein